MGRDDSRRAVLDRTRKVWQDVYDALVAGIDTAIYLHECAGWDHQDDKHLYQHMIRRKAAEVFQSLKPEPEAGFDESDTSVLPMSGLLLYLPDDVVRIWHIATLHIPTPGTPAKLDFVKQPRSDQEPLWDQIIHRQQRHERNHLVLRWTVHEHRVERFDLIRPIGARKRRVVVEWTEDLLPHLKHRRDRDGNPEGDGPATG